LDTDLEVPMPGVIAELELPAAHRGITDALVAEEGGQAPYFYPLPLGQGGRLNLAADPRQIRVEQDRERGPLGNEWAIGLA